MKIHADKIESQPPHQLRLRDVRLILAAVPPEWITEIKEVRLANSRRWPGAWFSRYDGCLRIYARYGTKAQAVEAILLALAANSIGINRGIRRRWIEKEKQRLNELIQPMTGTILAALNPPREPAFAPLKELKFAPFPNDVTETD